MRTSATRWGALTIRHRVCADSISLNAIATPAVREPGPLVTRVRSRTVAKVDSKLSCQAAALEGSELARARSSASFHMRRMMTLASCRL